jgi:16S rRNA processing protein RimM
MDYITIGKVANAHGVKGDIKIFPTTDDINRFKLLKRVYLEQDNKRIEVTIQGIKFVKHLVVLQTKELNTIEDALALKNASVLIPMDEALPLEENENFIFELIGLEARELDGTILGKLTEVISSGAHDVYVIDDGTKNGLMVPAKVEFIPEVNVEEGYLTVRLIEGLRGL